MHYGIECRNHVRSGGSPEQAEMIWSEEPEIFHASNIVPSRRRSTRRLQSMRHIRCYGCDGDRERTEVVVQEDAVRDQATWRTEAEVSIVAV
jgi:hypothetical protein